MDYERGRADWRRHGRGATDASGGGGRGERGGREGHARSRSDQRGRDQDWPSSDAGRSHGHDRSSPPRQGA
eukprot:9771464-Alexandrium_andersonii.AAC.1